MKTLYYSIGLAVILLFGCRSIEKMVDEGRYDDAIYLATKKLAGKKNKKTKHIQALEEAFAKVNAQDLNRINYLKSSGDSSAWDEVYHLLTKVEWRQERVAGFLPLISKEGYVADFAFINTGTELQEAAITASEYHYNSGKVKLERAKASGSKWLAREGYSEFTQASKYFHYYKDVRELRAKAKLFGTTHVLIKWEDQFQASLPGHSIYAGLNIHNLNNTWTAFYANYPEDIALDQVATIRMRDFFISPEREEVNRLIERRTLESWVDATDRRGNAVLNTAGNVIQVLQTEEVEARIQDIQRYKNMRMDGFVEVVNYNTGDLIHSEPWEVTINFASNACRFNGDRRALTEGTQKRVNPSIEPFPSDFSMITEAIGIMNNRSYKILEEVNWNQFVSESYATY